MSGPVPSRTSTALVAGGSLAFLVADNANGVAREVIVGLGLALRRLGHLVWLGWVLLVLGPLSLLTGAAIGPEASYLLLVVMAFSLAARPVRAAARP